MAADNPTAIAVDLAYAATMAGGVERRAEALLEALGRITPQDALFIGVFDPDRGRYVVLAQHGYERVDQLLESSQFARDLDRAGTPRRETPLRVADLTIPVESLPSWSDHFSPAGFREALGVGLFAADGRYLGVVGFCMADAPPADDAACELLHRVAPLVARAVDPLTTASAASRLVGTALAGAVVGWDDDTPTTLPGLPDHPLLAAGSPALSAALSRLRAGVPHVTLLSPYADHELLRVTAQACPPQPVRQVRAVVTLSPPPPLRGLTRRELEVLGLLVDGCTNADIATALAITVRTAVNHVEHIMDKLEAGSRTIAAVLARTEGLFIPPTLRSCPRR